jgi:hypothetical protein
VKEQMDKSDAVRLQLASRYAQIANYWKYFIGQTEQLKHLKVYDQKSSEEQQFQTWTAGHTEYAQVLPNLKKAYDDYRPYNLHGTYLREGILGSVLAGFGASFLDLEKELMKPVVDSAALKKALGNVATRYKTYFLKLL